MIKELVQYLLGVGYKHISVNHVGYKREININDQNNNKSFQFIIESDDAILEKQIVMGVVTIRLNIDIIGFVGKDVSPLDIQDEGTHIAFDVLEYIQNDNEFGLEIHDYSMIPLVEYTDDNSAGVRLSLQLVIPNPINLCEYESNFIDKPEPIVEHIDLANGDDCTNTRFQDNGSTLKLSPIRLK